MRSTTTGATLANLVGLVGLLLARSIQAHPTLAGVRGMYTWMDNAEQAKTPVLNIDFPDPSLIEGPDRQWYAFATASTTFGSHKLVQYATAANPLGPWKYVNEDLLRGNAGAWTNQRDIWAPDVRKVDDGTYVMYYTAALAKNARVHCLGVATAAKVTGPWSVADKYWQCDEDRGGSIDSSGFHDDEARTRWVVYKIDGNARGNGGSCGNSVPPIQSTPIMLQQVGGDGVTRIGDPVQILDRTDADGPLVEAPNIVRSSDGGYVLFYSSHCFDSPEYNVLYATASAVTGPYTRASRPFLETHMFNLTSPGGGTIAVPEEGSDDVTLFHARCPSPVGGSNRCLFASSFTETGKVVLANP